MTNKKIHTSIYNYIFINFFQFPLMKKLIIAVAAIATAVACNTAEIVELPKNPAISFENAYVKNATRDAVDPSTTTASIEAFDVWAFMDETSGIVLVDEDVTKGANGWSYANVQYWAPGHTYYFGALAPMNSANWDLDTSKAGKLGAGVVSFTNIDGTEDLLYSAVEVSTADLKLGEGMDPVKLTFSHLLSKVKFTFKNGFATDNVSIKVKDVTMTVPAAATLDLNTADWWEGDKWVLGTENLTLQFGSVATTLGMGIADEADNERLTIPASAAYEYNVKFYVDVYMGDVLAIDNHEFTATIKDIALQMGKAYNFTATINPENLEMAPIVFEVVEVKEWVDANTPSDQVKDAELRAAAQFGGEVILTEDIALSTTLDVTKNLIIDLNGHNLTINNDSDELGEGDGIIVTEGTLTIKGEGTVTANTRAIWARGNGGAVINIEGGHYVGATKGNTCEVIYASGNGVVNIYGGTFEAETEDNVSFAAPQYAVLNIHGNGATGCDIVVYGGSFKNFNPADNISENPKKNFCADNCVAVADGEWYKVLTKTISVKSAEELVNAFGAALEIEIAADIDLSNTAWTPVGTEDAPFVGSINGQGHTLSGLNASGDYAALIAFAGANTSVKNVVFEDVNIDSSKYGAAVVAVGNDNVVVENVTVSGTVKAASYAAGIVCLNSEKEDPSVTIKNCVNNATVTSNRAGGVAAWMTGNSVIEGCVNNGDVTGAISACGITNRIQGSVKNCVNNGTIVGNGTEASAGIAGTQTAASSYEYCYNYGNVTTTKDNANSSAAGILGQANKAATINYCANYGAITAEKSYAAGIAYSLYGTITASYCYNEGAVIGEEAAGGIAPKAQYGANDTAKYCLNAGALTATSAKGKVYQGSNKNTSCYYYNAGALLNVADNAAVAEADALAVLNGGADANFFSVANGVITVK